VLQVERWVSSAAHGDQRNVMHDARIIQPAWRRVQTVDTCRARCGHRFVARL